MLRKLILSKPLRYWFVAWCFIGTLGAITLAQHELTKIREAFETDARIAHRLLSQRAVQHEAILATLALLQPSIDASIGVEKLPTLYPQILSIQRRGKDTSWDTSELQVAETQSRATGHAALANVDFQLGRYRLVLFAQPSSFSLEMDLRAMVPWNEWSMSPEKSPVRVTLEHQGQAFTLQTGLIADGGWRFLFHKHLAADSQPFNVMALRQVSWIELPWLIMLSWFALVALSLFVLFFLLRQRQQRLRAEELLRLGQVARLNTMGELAAGMAHEINQPLTAVLANTQAAVRLLSEDSPEVAQAKTAMAQAADQAKRASNVVSRLRRLIEQPNEVKPLGTVSLVDSVSNALHLLAPELHRNAITVQIKTSEIVANVVADPIALEQNIHNLLMNAVQALEQVPANERHLVVQTDIDTDLAQGVLTISDTGPGITDEELPRLFEPFFSTRADGLGLGLSLCESLANRMEGELSAKNHVPRGASFTLRLPLERV